MAKYVKLGKKAEIFFDPTTRTKVLKNQVVKLENRDKFSKKITAAIAGGHLVNSTKEEYNDYLEDNQLIENTQEQESWIEPWLEANDIEEKTLKSLKHQQLVELTSHFGSQYTLAELKDSTKAELIEEIIELNSEEEEDED